MPYRPHRRRDRACRAPAQAGDRASWRAALSWRRCWTRRSSQNRNASRRGRERRSGRMTSGRIKQGYHPRRRGQEQPARRLTMANLLGPFLQQGLPSQPGNKDGAERLSLAIGNPARLPIRSTGTVLCALTVECPFAYREIAAATINKILCRFWAHGKTQAERRRVSPCQLLASVDPAQRRPNRRANRPARAVARRKVPF